MLTAHMLTTPHMLTPFWPSEKATYLMAQEFQKIFMTQKPTYFHFMDFLSFMRKIIVDFSSIVKHTLFRFSP